MPRALNHEDTDKCTVTITYRYGLMHCICVTYRSKEGSTDSTVRDEDITDIRDDITYTG